MTIIVLLEGKIYSETDSETDFDSTNWVFFGNRCGAKQEPVWKSLAIISKEQSFSKPKLHGRLESMWIESQVENNVQQNNYQYSKCTFWHRTASLNCWSYWLLHKDDPIEHFQLAQPASHLTFTM